MLYSCAPMSGALPLVRASPRTSLGTKGVSTVVVPVSMQGELLLR